VLCTNILTETYEILCRRKINDFTILLIYIILFFSRSITLLLKLIVMEVQ